MSADLRGGPAALAIAVRCAEDAFRALVRPSALAVLAVPFTANLAWLGALSLFPRPPLDRAVPRVVTLLGVEQATHYPDYYAYLPRLLGATLPAVEILVSLPALVVLTAALPSLLHRGRWCRGATRAGLSRLGTVYLACGPALASSALFGAAAWRITGAGEGGALAMASLGAETVGLALRAAFLYALPAVVVGGLGAGGAIARSVVLAVELPGPTAAFVLFEVLLRLPLRLDPTEGLRMFNRVPPEATMLILVGAALSASLAAGVTTACASRLYLHRHGTGAVA